MEVDRCIAKFYGRPDIDNIQMNNVIESDGYKVCRVYYKMVGNAKYYAYQFED